MERNQKINCTVTSCKYNDDGRQEKKRYTVCNMEIKPCTSRLYCRNLTISGHSLFVSDTDQTIKKLQRNTELSTERITPCKQRRKEDYREEAFYTAIKGIG